MNHSPTGEYRLPRFSQIELAWSGNGMVLTFDKRPTASLARASEILLLLIMACLENQSESEEIHPQPQREPSARQQQSSQVQPM